MPAGPVLGSRLTQRKLRISRKKLTCAAFSVRSWTATALRSNSSSDIMGLAL